LRLVGFTLVRNEEDVIEASIRHNLRSLDAIAVVDHASDDATPAILDALVAEGLPITVRRDASLELRQAAATNAGVRELLAGGADLAIPIDADEFLRLPSRERFEALVAANDPAVHLAMPWQTYLPPLDEHGDLAGRLRRARRLSAERHGLHKVVVRRSFLDTPRAEIGTGNHRVTANDPGGRNPHDAVPGDVAAMAHVPIRSVAQFTAKIAVGALAVRLADLADKTLAFHWHEEFEALVAGQPLTPARVATIVANYSVPPERRLALENVEWVDDPFVGDLALRYTPRAEPNALARVLAFGERVAAEVGRTTGGM
jgi:hypothetical protein